MDAPVIITGGIDDDAFKFCDAIDDICPCAKLMVLLPRVMSIIIISPENKNMLDIFKMITANVGVTIIFEESNSEWTQKRLKRSSVIL